MESNMPCPKWRGEKTVDESRQFGLGSLAAREYRGRTREPLARCRRVSSQRRGLRVGRRADRHAAIAFSGSPWLNEHNYLIQASWPAKVGKAEGFKAHTEPKYFSMPTIRRVLRPWSSSATKRPPFNAVIHADTGPCREKRACAAPRPAQW